MKLSEDLKLGQTTEWRGDVKAADRDSIVSGTKESLNKLFKTKLGKALYFRAFCESWGRYIEDNLTKLNAKKVQGLWNHLNSIKAAVLE